MNLRAYLDSLHGKTVAVIGIGVSNTPLVKLLCREGISVTACDRRSRADLGELAGELEGAGAALQLGDGYLENLTQDVIFRTPGLRPDVPQLREAVARGSVLTSEMEEFFHVCPCPIIAVTGSDGKTTTTTIIAELLRAAGKTVHVGGNIGHPLLCEAGEMAPDGLGRAGAVELPAHDDGRQPAHRRHDEPRAEPSRRPPRHGRVRRVEGEYLLPPAAGRYRSV